MSSEVLGTAVKLRLFAPGDDKFSAHATGIIVECLPTEGEQAFHDGYRIKLDSPIVVEGIEIMALSICPSCSYPLEPGKDKILDLLREPVYVTVSWSLPDGTGYTFGEKGTFAELGLLQ